VTTSDKKPRKRTCSKCGCIGIYDEERRLCTACYEKEFKNQGRFKDVTDCVAGRFMCTFYPTVINLDSNFCAKYCDDANKEKCWYKGDDALGPKNEHILNDVSIKQHEGENVHGPCVLKKAEWIDNRVDELVTAIVGRIGDCRRRREHNTQFRGKAQLLQWIDELKYHIDRDFDKVD
jgi:hypothetical protein